MQNNSENKTPLTDVEAAEQLFSPTFGVPSVPSNYFGNGLRVFSSIASVSLPSQSTPSTSASTTLPQVAPSTSAITTPPPLPPPTSTSVPVYTNLYKCEFPNCKFRGKHMYTLRNHIGKLHPADAKNLIASAEKQTPYKCPKCPKCGGKKFHDRKALTVHIHTEHGFDPNLVAILEQSYHQTGSP